VIEREYAEALERLAKQQESYRKRLGEIRNKPPLERGCIEFPPRGPEDLIRKMSDEVVKAQRRIYALEARIESSAKPGKKLLNEHRREKELIEALAEARDVHANSRQAHALNDAQFELCQDFRRDLYERVEAFLGELLAYPMVLRLRTVAAKPEAGANAEQAVASQPTLSAMALANLFVKRVGVVIEKRRRPSAKLSYRHNAIEWLQSPDGKTRLISQGRLKEGEDLTRAEAIRVFIEDTAEHEEAFGGEYWEGRSNAVGGEKKVRSVDKKYIKTRREQDKGALEELTEHETQTLGDADLRDVVASIIAQIDRVYSEVTS
jgi:hypothetical protein